MKIYLLVVAVLLAVTQAHSTRVLQVDDCVTNSTDPDCVDYVLPDDTIKPLISMLCGMMGHMPGCTINNICQEPKYSGDPLCKPFAVYKVICNDMPGMGSCATYKSMCTPVNGTSVVKQCETPMVAAPTSGGCSNLITEMCAEMPMDGCSVCFTSGCEWLRYYSNFCLSMPGMSECVQWKTMCEPISDWPLCVNSAESGPIMRMYFHTGILDYVLFKNWVPDTNAYYAATWFAIFVFGIMYELLKLVRSRLEKKWNAEFEGQAENQMLLNSSIFTAQMPFIWRVDLLRAFLHLLEVGWGLLIMLIAMTFNVGLFFAVLAGAFVGMLFVGRFIHYVPKASCH
jgi:hypothetical protein